MKIGAPKETFEGENRVAMTPESALQLQKLGHDCVIETKAGEKAGFSDKAYTDAGVEVVKTAAALWKAADIVAKVREPDAAEMKKLRDGQTLISFFNPGANEKKMAAAADAGFFFGIVPRNSAGGGAGTGAFLESFLGAMSTKVKVRGDVLCVG